jgi:excisionase family DNA binding protein
LAFPYNHQCKHCPTLIRTEAGKTDTEQERFYTISEAARLLKVSDQSIRRWVKAGELKAYKPKKEYRIAESDLQEFLEGRTVPLVQTPLPKLPEERRGDAGEVALEAARRQLTQDRQAAARAFESERPQTYFMRHDNEAIARLMQYSPDELADSLLELARGYVELQERRQLSVEDFPAEQVAAFLAENERDNERIRRELEKMSAKECREALLAVSPRLRKYYREESTSREISEKEQGKSA